MPSRSASGRWQLCLIGAASALILLFYFPFTADDAYIYLRYAANFVDSGALVFNSGERVSTLTSPLLALVKALLYASVPDPTLGYKLVSLGCLAATALVVLRQAPREPWIRAGVTACVLLSPPVLLWTVGGMETPVLMLLVTLATAQTLQPDGGGRSGCYLVMTLSGVAFVTRQDSAPYMAALALQALSRQKQVGTAATAVACGAAVPLTWSAVALSYYGDLFPTSFYVKTPSAAASNLLQNACYIAQYLVQAGIVPFVVAVFVWARPTTFGLRTHARRNWGIWLGIGLQLAYGLTSATVHMMFCFRYFVPYIPAALLLVSSAAGSPSPGRRRPLVFVALLSAFLIAQAQYTYQRSLQGFALNGELREGTVEELIQFAPRSLELIDRVEQHWEGLATRPGPTPRIWTFAEGLMPYTYRAAYFMGDLVSYRHRCSRRPNAADYVLVLMDYEPEGGAIASLPVQYRRRIRYLVAFYNRFPKRERLPVRVDDDCPS